MPRLKRGGPTEAGPPLTLPPPRPGEGRSYARPVPGRARVRGPPRPGLVRRVRKA